MSQDPYEPPRPGSSTTPPPYPGNAEEARYEDAPYENRSPAQGNARGLAIGGLVAALVGLIFFGIILGPVGAVLGFIAHRRGERGLAMAAMVVGVIVFVLNLVGVVILAND